MNQFRALATAQLKAFTRDRMLLFWTLAFPVMFLVLFGGIFASDGDTAKIELQQVGPVSLFDQMPAQAKKGVDEVLSITKTDDRAAALDKLRKGDQSGVITMEGNRLRLYYRAADPVQSGIVQGTLNSMVSAANLAASGRPPTFTMDAQQVEDSSLKQIQYVTPGLLAWAVSMGGVFGAALTLVQWRKNGLLRRLRMSPVRTESLVLSRSLITVLLALVQFAVFVGLGMGAFGLKLTGSWWAALPLLILGAFAFQSIGLVVGAVSKTEEAASGFANLVVLPMAFLSGSFFPLDDAPSWIRTLANFLPMGHLNQGMSAVMVRGEGPSAILIPALVLLGFTVFFSLLAARLFRWED